MSGLIESVARRLGVPRERVEREAVEAWLRRRLLLLEAEIAEILGRYGGGSIGELEEMVADGRIPEHPGWEDLVVLERLAAEKRRVEEALSEWVTR